MGCLGYLNGMMEIGVSVAYWVGGDPLNRIRAHRYEGAYFSLILSQWLTF